MRSLTTLLVLSLLCFALGGHATDQVALQTDGAAHTTESWGYIDCGSCAIYPVFPTLIAVTGLPTDIVQIQSISIKPDPPKPGQELTVTVTALATDIIEVPL
jgi:hypothetical protein